MKERIDYIDIAKGIGIVLVIMCHTGYLGVLSTYIDAFFMPLFFVTAGMVYRTPSNKREFVKKKTKVLLLPYFAWNAVCILATIFMGRKIGFDAILGVLYGRFAFLKSGIDTHTTYLLHYNNSHLWFLPCMFFSTVLYMLIDTSITDSKKKNILVVILALFGGCAGKLCPVFLPWSIDVATVMPVFMHLGACMKKIVQGYRGGEKYTKYGLLLSVAVFICVAKINGSVNVSLSDYGRSFFVFFISATIGSGLTVFLSQKVATLHNNPIMVYLKFLGKNSMDIFGLHMLLVTIMAHFVNKIIVVTGMSNYDWILRSGIISLTFVLPVSGAGYLFILMKKRMLRVAVTASEK